ncbi:MAG: MBL fold metallo-hydrolase [Flavobacteriales bacterium]|nr:MBL fold metallo-hydrolase [Flavobacteriales bacterium]
MSHLSTLSITEYGQRMSISITFHGAAGMVTGSKHLLEITRGEDPTLRLLLDCGMFQGEGPRSDEKNRRFGFDPTTIDAIVLSHAHIDHSGLLPRLVREGYRGPIHATPPTRDLCAVMLADSAHIQEMDLEFDLKRARRQGRAPKEIEPLYAIGDVAPTMELFETLRYGVAKEILPGVKLVFTDAGHILGSACVHLDIDTADGVHRLTFSGDVGRYVDRLLPDPEPFRQADTIICESTYGDRDHAAVEVARDELLAHVREVCVERKGKLIIPAFSIGKTQEVLHTLNKLYNEGRLPRVPVIVDSPLSINATAIYREHASLLQEDVRAELTDDPDLFGFRGVEFVRDAARSKQLNERQEPCIVIAASGMMEAGRIRHHLFHGLPNERNAVLIIGFCAPGTLGADIMEKPEHVQIFGERVPVRAEILRMESYSAHADRGELSRWIRCQDPASVSRLFLVHGIQSSLTGLRERFQQEGFARIDIPQQGQKYTF